MTKKNRKGMLRKKRRDLLKVPVDAEIIAIRRKSDGQEFKVGDRLIGNNTIRGFGHHYGDISILFDGFIHGNCVGTLPPVNAQ